MNKLLKSIGSLFLYLFGLIASFAMYMNLFVRGGNPCCNYWGGDFMIVGLAGLGVSYLLKGGIKKVFWFIGIFGIMLFFSSIFASMTYSCLCEKL